MDKQYEDMIFEYKKQTPQAILVSDGYTSAWIPKSTIKNWYKDYGISYRPEPGEYLTLVVKIFILKEKGFI